MAICKAINPQGHSHISEGWGITHAPIAHHYLYPMTTFGFVSHGNKFWMQPVVYKLHFHLYSKEEQKYQEM